MPDYTCERCLKEFSQKSHYDKHMNRKTPCQNNKKTLEKVVENIITNKIEPKKSEITLKNTITETDHAFPKIEIATKNGEKTQQIVKGDCIEGMKKIKDDSVDIVICDPPYNIGKDFGNNSDRQKMDDYLVWCDEWIAECIRILKPAGTLYIYGFSEILAFIRVRININVRWIIWHYTNKVTPSLNFWQRTHESILCCYKEKPVFNKDDVREPLYLIHI